LKAESKKGKGKMNNNVPVLEFSACPLKSVIIVSEDSLGGPVVELREVDVEFGIRSRYNDQLGLEGPKYDAPELFQYRRIQMLYTICLFFSCIIDQS